MTLQTLTAQAAILGLIHPFLAADASPLHAAPRYQDLRQLVQQFGVGADLKVKLAGGDSLRGSVQAIGRDSFLLGPISGAAPREIAYEELENVRYPHRAYTAEEAPDPAAAKRMVVQLGVGEHIMVKVSPTQKVRGYIRAVGEDHFVIQPDRQTTMLEIPYSDVWKVHKNLSFGATVAIVVGIAAVTVLILVLSGSDDVDVLPG
jgi:hypothetical protein